MDERFAKLDDDGKLRFSLHPGQSRAWRSVKRFVAIIAGTQSGKTVFGAVWLWREIKQCGPGDYMVAAPSYPLLALKVLPTFLWLFEKTLGLGTYNKTDHVFYVSAAGEVKLFGERQSADTKIFFGHARNPDSLESATAKAAWLDEAGQKDFKLGSWEAILRRLSIHEGRVLITSTLYNLGWLVQKIWKPWQEGDETIEVVRFESRMNPAFPETEWRRAKGSLPKWKFDLQYRGVPTRPAGLIYDNFTDDMLRPRFEIPDHWPRLIGVDFGAVNTAALFYAQSPDGPLYLYREYKHAGRTAKQHAKAMLKDEPHPKMVCGGSKSEKQWRHEFRVAGLPVLGPIVSDVEVGIDRVYEQHGEEKILVFDDLDGYLEEKRTYARALNELGQPTDKIEDKHSYHFMDAERYIISRYAQTGTRRQAVIHY